MPLHVNILPTSHGAAKCNNCEVWREVTFVFTVSAVGGCDIAGPICLHCLSQGAALFALIEPPDLSPGRKPPSRRIRKRTDKEEQELADLSGGRRQKGSGAIPYLKGDFHRKGVYRGESKSVFGKSPSWTLDELTKIRGEAAWGEVPVLVTTFMDKHTHAVKERWATIPFENWQEKYAPSDAE